VRDIEEDIIDKIKQISIIPNYFDDQRFSDNNSDIGLAMIRKDFNKAASLIIGHQGFHEDIIRQHLEKYPNDHVGAIRKMPKKIISMYIHSVQSLMFNNALAKILKEQAEKNSIRCKQVKYSEGEFMFYNDGIDYEKIPVKELSLVGFDTNLMQTEIAEQMISLQITQRDFIIRAIPEMTMEGSSRDCFAQVQDFSYEKLDEKTAKLRFSLQKGSYATIVVKALMG
jgi:tRNA(Glu) U13 pseudouridine synthase TruD